MEYKFLPEAVKNALSLPEGTEPDFALRGSGALAGRPGESYVILSSHEVFIFERNFGGTSFGVIRIDARDPSLKAELRKDKFSSLLNIGGSEVKLSNFEAGTASMLVEKIHELQHHGLREQEIEPTPYLLLLMMLIDLGVRTGQEGKLAPTSENFIINEVCSGNRKLFLSARALYDHGRLDEIFQSLALDNAQKRCMLANMLEMVMRDGEFSGSEQQLIHEAAARLDMTREDFNRIWNVILDKNCLSILTGR